MRKSGVKLALLFSLITPLSKVHAEAIMISGKLEADMPEVAFNKDQQDLVAFVNTSTITASGKGSACNISVDDRATSTVGNLVCFFEWLPNSFGFAANGFTTSGIPSQVGEIKLPYKISYYSGSERQKVEVVTGEYKVQG